MGGAHAVKAVVCHGREGPKCAPSDMPAVQRFEFLPKWAPGTPTKVLGKSLLPVAERPLPERRVSSEASKFQSPRSYEPPRAASEGILKSAQEVAASVRKPRATARCKVVMCIHSPNRSVTVNARPRRCIVVRIPGVLSVISRRT